MAGLPWRSECAAKLWASTLQIHRHCVRAPSTCCRLLAPGFGHRHRRQATDLHWHYKSDRPIIVYSICPAKCQARGNSIGLFAFVTCGKLTGCHAPFLWSREASPVLCRDGRPRCCLQGLFAHGQQDSFVGGYQAIGSRNQGSPSRCAITILESCSAAQAHGPLAQQQREAFQTPDFS